LSADDPCPIKGAIRAFQSCRNLLFVLNMQLPGIIDNQSAETQLDAVLNYFICPFIGDLSIAVGYFYLSGFEKILAGLEQNESYKTDQYKEGTIRFIMSPRTDKPTGTVLTLGHEENSEINTKELARSALREFEADLKHIDADTAAKFLFLLKNRYIQVKLYTKDFFHAKAYIARVVQNNIDHHYSIVGSSNFSASGLTSNRELSMVSKDEQKYDALKNWFDIIWNSEAELFNEDLLKIIEASGLTKKEPGQIQFLPVYLTPFEMLTYLVSHYLGRHIIDQLQEADQLAEFQRIGSENIVHKLERYEGAIVADSVGLGKTFTAGEVIRRYHSEGKNIILVLPPKLLDQWKTTLANHFSVLESETVVFISMGELSQWEPVEVSRKLKNIKFDLIVVDEAHRARNTDTDLYKNLKELHPKTGRAHVILLTATPLNNSVHDLKNLLALCTQETTLTNAGLVFKAFDVFEKHTRELRKGKKLSEIEKDPEYIQARDQIKDILNHTMLLRMRSTIREKYNNIRIAGKPLVFKDPTVEKITYSYDATYHNLFDSAGKLLEKLTLPHIILSNPKGGKTLTHLYQLLLFKRLESSIYAFYISLQRIIEKEKILLEEIDNEDWEALIEKYNKKVFEDEEASFFDTVEENELRKQRIEKGNPEFSTEIKKDDIEKWIDEDIELIRAFIQEHITSKLEEPDNPLSLRDEKIDLFIQKLQTTRYRKALVFTQFISTAEYIHYKLKKSEKHSLLGLRFDFTHGSDDGLNQKLNRFAPIGRNANMPEKDQLDLLVTTDVLAEGVNLQDADLLINFDLPWNPMRIVQRVGRVNRIGSENQVRVLNFAPDRFLDSFLNLLNILYSKIKQVTILLGKEMAILSSEEEAEEIKPEDIGEEIRKVQDTTDITALERLSGSNRLLAQIEGETPEDFFRVQLYNAARENNIRSSDFKKFIHKSDEHGYYTIINKRPEDIYRLYEIYGERSGYKSLLQRFWYAASIDGDCRQTDSYPQMFLTHDIIQSDGITLNETENIDAIQRLTAKMETYFSNQYSRIKAAYGARVTSQRIGGIAGTQRDLLTQLDTIFRSNTFTDNFSISAQEYKAGFLNTIQELRMVMQSQIISQDQVRKIRKILEDHQINIGGQISQPQYLDFCRALDDMFHGVVLKDAAYRGVLYTPADITYRWLTTIYI